MNIKMMEMRTSSLSLFSTKTVALPFLNRKRVLCSILLYASTNKDDCLNHINPSARVRVLIQLFRTVRTTEVTAYWSVVQTLLSINMFLTFLLLQHSKAFQGKSCGCEASSFTTVYVQSPTSTQCWMLLIITQCFPNLNQAVLVAKT